MKIKLTEENLDEITTYIGKLKSDEFSSDENTSFTPKMFFDDNTLYFLDNEPSRFLVVREFLKYNILVNTYTIDSLSNVYYVSLCREDLKDWSDYLKEINSTS